MTASTTRLILNLVPFVCATCARNGFPDSYLGHGDPSARGPLSVRPFGIIRVSPNELEPNRHAEVVFSRRWPGRTSVTGSPPITPPLASDRIGYSGVRIMQCLRANLALNPRDFRLAQLSLVGQSTSAITHSPMRERKHQVYRRRWPQMMYRSLARASPD